MIKKMTFLGWALTQVHRQDAIGEIARRIHADPHFPGSQPWTSAKGILRRAGAYLASIDASDEDMKMLVHAVEEYSMQRNRLPLMTTFTLELPVALAKQLQALSAEKFTSFHAAALLAIEEQIQALEVGGDVFSLPRRRIGQKTKDTMATLPIRPESLTLIVDVPAPVAAKWYAFSEEERRRRLPGLIEMIEAVDKDTDPATREPYEEPPVLTRSEEAALDIAWCDLARERKNEKEASQRRSD